MNGFPDSPAPESGLQVLPEFDGAEAPAGPPIFRLGDLADLDLHVEVPLGHLDVDIRQLLALRIGDTLKLDRQTGEHLEITVNGMPFARGEVRVHGEKFAVRITQILHDVSIDEVGGEDVDAPKAVSPKAGSDS
jgi:flagellar motor switch protein FliN/FliY